MSGSQYLFDTNIIVPFLNGDESIVSQFKELETIQLPSITLGELYFGAYKSSNTDRNLAKIKEFIRLYCKVYYPTSVTAQVYGRLKQILGKQGTPIPENDIWIAALTKENELLLVTRDKHFTNLQELDVIKW